MSAVAERVLQSWACNFVLSKAVFKMYKHSMNYMTTRTKGPYFGNEKAFHPEAMGEYEVCDMMIQVLVNNWTIF